MTMLPTIRSARTRLSVARTGIVRLDPYLSGRETWTLFKGPKPGRRGALTTRGMTGTGR